MGVFYPQCKAFVSLILDGFSGPGSDSDPITIPVVPREARIHKNKYHDADTWELTFEASDMPIDPQLVRAGSVAIYLYQTQGLIQANDPRAISSVDDSSLAGRGPDEIGQTELGLTGRDLWTSGQKEPIIAGIFDQQSLEMSGSGKWITITGQDYTALLAAKQWKPEAREGATHGRARRIPTGKRLDQWATDILSEADAAGVLSVLVEGIPASGLPVVGENEPSHLKKRGIPIETGTSYWDVLYKTILRHGFICFVRGLNLVITRPKNLEAIATATVKRLAWGVNIESMELSRNLGKEKVPRIVAVSYNPKTREHLTVEYPEFGQASPVGTVASKTTGGGKTKKGKPRKQETEDQYQIVQLWGETDLVTMRRAAENLFRILGRSERRMVVVTKDLRDMDGDDMLSLSSGDAVAIRWQDFDANVIGNDETSEADKISHMTKRGIAPGVASAIARNYTRFLSVDRPLRVREVTYDWSVDNGVSIEMDLVDFVVADGERGENAVATNAKTPGRLIR